MKYLLLPLLLTGCMFQAVDDVDIERANQACGVGQLYKIESHFQGTEIAECRNGQLFKLAR